MTTQNYLLERMEKIDRDIEKLERDVTMMQKQIGKRLQKISILNEERAKASMEYRSMTEQLSKEA